MKGISKWVVCGSAIFLGWSGALKFAVAGSLPELWFPVGETLTYDMHYGFVHVGQTLVTTEWINEQGHVRLAIRFVTKTNKFFDKVYPVDDFVESIIDPETFLPVRMHKRIREGDFQTEETTTFDYEARMAHWVSRKAERDYKISEDTRDIVAFMFMMRKTPLEGGNFGSYWVAGDDGMCRLAIRGGSVRDIELENFGTVAAMRLVPDVTRDKLFVRKMPREVWVSSDPRRLIVKMAVKAPIGNVTLTLAQVGGPGDDFWTRKSLRRQSGELAGRN